MSSFDYEDIPEDAAEWMREMVLQFERTESASAAQHKAFQDNALLALVGHAIEKIPTYGSRLKPLIRQDGNLDLDGWSDIPILTKSQAIDLGEELMTVDVPEEHLPISISQTSGSTGQPFTYKATKFHHTMWSCVTARYHRWYGFDYSQKFASIRPFPLKARSWPKGKEQTGWGVGVLNPESPGKYFTLNINTPVDQQVEWLRRVKPSYLHTMPSNLRAIVQTVKEDGGKPLRLKGVLAYAEMLTDDTRNTIVEGLGCDPKACYSSRECGYMALQSPVSENYLVQSEVCLVEILDKKNRPCMPGETGRVVVTALHNYAHPLIRYDIGDYATLGAADKSGLPFPVLSRIQGRSRNLFRLSGDRLIQPDFKTPTFQKFLNPKQWQVAQIGPAQLEIRVVPKVEMSEMDTDGMSAYIHELLGDDLDISYKLVSELTNPRTGKHEDYICELSDT